MSYTLYTDVGNFRAFKILIAAKYNNVDIAVPEFAVGIDNITPAFLKKSPLARVPVLDTPQGSLFESNAIARYVARLRNDTELFGQTFFDAALVDNWIHFSTNDVELYAILCNYPYLDSAPGNLSLINRAKAELSKSLTILESHLADKTYIVGHKVTLADIVLVSALVYPFKFVADAAYRAPFPNVVRWFTTLVNQPQFEAVIGKMVLAERYPPLLRNFEAVAPKTPQKKPEPRLYISPSSVSELEVTSNSDWDELLRVRRQSPSDPRPFLSLLQRQMERSAVKCVRAVDVLQGSSFDTYKKYTVDRNDALAKFRTIGTVAVRLTATSEDPLRTTITTLLVIPNEEAEHYISMGYREVLVSSFESVVAAFLLDDGSVLRFQRTYDLAH